MITASESVMFCENVMIVIYCYALSDVAYVRVVFLRVY